MRGFPQVRSVGSENTISSRCLIKDCKLSTIWDSSHYNLGSRFSNVAQPNDSHSYEEEDPGMVIILATELGIVLHQDRCFVNF